MYCFQCLACLSRCNWCISGIKCCHSEENMEYPSEDRTILQNQHERKSFLHKREDWLNLYHQQKMLFFNMWKGYHTKLDSVANKAWWKCKFYLHIRLGLEITRWLNLWMPYWTCFPAALFSSYKNNVHFAHKFRFIFSSFIFSVISEIGRYSLFLGWVEFVLNNSQCGVILSSTVLSVSLSYVNLGATWDMK